MPPSNSLWNVPSLQRYRPVLFALTALALGCTIYYVNGSLSSRNQTPKNSGTLHRSNANRRRRRPRPVRTTEDSPERSPTRESGGELQTNAHPWQDLDARTEAESENSWGADGADEEDLKDGRSLLTLLYRIAEEQNRKDGYVHRGVQCNNCNENPIRGIRYRCVNCTDYDLCEQCEAMQMHPKTHLFYKIRIPAPFIGAHKERQPVLYPGRPKAVTQDLRKDKLDRFCRETGLKIEEVEAIWEQFRCMAATDWPDDPDHYHLAIDRTTFDKCFVPTGSSRQIPPNLIYDRIFSYYDTNHDGLIGFDEFVKGFASLKRKNFDERLKRIFNGYDLDGDGYIDRRDVLRMFRSFYALTRDLTAEIVSGMQEDTDEGDARDVILGGQPISSAFTGSIPRGDISRANQGKARNPLGDDVVIDGLGAVDNEESQVAFDLDELVADNAERALAPDAPAKASGKEIWEFSQNSDWKTVAAELEEFGIAVQEDCDIDAQSLLRRELQTKLAGDFLRRRFARRKAVMLRAQRQYFKQDNDENSRLPLNFPLEAGGMLADPRLHTRMSKDLLEIKTSRERTSEFRSGLDAMLQDLKWPVGNQDKFRDTLMTMTALGWNEKALAQDLDSFTPDPNVVSSFVLAYSDLLNRMAGEARKEPNFKKEFKKVEPSNRSRSSSKVRFEDDVGEEDEDDIQSATSISSRNRPVNERWGGFEVPEPEADIGREVIYQVTQEALVELLDPVFQLREDLALHALLTRKNRARCRDQIIASVADNSDVVKVRDYLDFYQRRWREGECPQAPPAHLHRDEALQYRQYVLDMEKGLENGLTGMSCPTCAKTGKQTFVKTGTRCPENNSHWKSLGVRPPLLNLIDPPEKCLRCAGNGQSSDIFSNYCGNCGYPCRRIMGTWQEVRQAVVNGFRAQPTDEISTDNAEIDEAKSEIAKDTAIEKTESKDSQNEKDIPKSDWVEWKEGEPNAVDAQEGDIKYPDIAIELHSSVTAFNESDIASIETEITSKTLDELLQDSGYGVIESQPSTEGEATQTPNPEDLTPEVSSSSDSPSTSAPDSRPDPTLPQNRPNSITTADTTSPSPSASHLSHSSTHEFNNSRGIGNGNSNNGKPDEKTPSPTPPPKSEDMMPSPALCRFFATMDLLEHEDEKRGGPGRLSFSDFEEVMKGAKGPTLGFLASWVEVGAF